MSGGRRPRVLIVYYTFTKQSGRVADAMAKEFEARGCEVTKALIEFTDERWVPKLFSQFPMKHPVAQISSDPHASCVTGPGRSVFPRKHKRAITTSC